MHITYLIPQLVIYFFYSKGFKFLLIFMLQHQTFFDNLVDELLMQNAYYE